MNDIEVLEELIKNEHGELLNCWDYGEEAIQAIENLLKENKDLQKSVDQIYEDYQDIGKMYFNLTEKIEKKIEELKEEYKIALEENSTKAFILKCQIQVLEELLKGE